MIKNSMQMILVSVLLGGCTFWTPGVPVEDKVPPRSDHLATFGSSPKPMYESPPTFAELEIPLAIEETPSPVEDQARLRFRSMQEAATSWGSQAGFHRRMWELQLMLIEREEILDTIFDFNRVSWPTPNGTGMIVPPVIRHSGAVWTGSEDGQTAAAADTFIEILAPGRIASSLPNWRDYLVSIPAPPSPVVESLLPYHEELPQWREWAAEGWKAGRGQAEMTLEANMDRLERDYGGMLEYRRLRAQNMVSDLVMDTASYQLGAEEDGNLMRVGERSSRIAGPARLIGDSSNWRPQIIASTPH
ncbi:MAG: hypothetical protein F4X24_03695 [Rhodobacteraceae bacterium]|nr:hypothetical protein [Paracoccaceae bacterium]